jgi:hypothetical protein
MKNSSNREIENQAKNTSKKHGSINANQEFTRCGNHHNILPLFGGLEGSLTFSPLLSYIMKHTHTSQKATMARVWERDG